MPEARRSAPGDAAAPAGAGPQVEEPDVRSAVDSHAELPLDPDPTQTGRAAAGPVAAERPVHLQPLLVALVVLGAALGTPARYAVSLAWPTRPGGWPTGTLVCNLAGAFALGVLLEALFRAGEDLGRRRLVRLGLGTGFLGAFTTYSTLAVETDLLLRAGRPAPAVGYAAGTVLAGLVLSAAGIRLATTRHARRCARVPVRPVAALPAWPAEDPDGGRGTVAGSPPPGSADPPSSPGRPS